MSKLIQIIIGSTRPGRIGDTIARCVAEVVKPIATESGIDIEIVDIADLGLPIFNEPGMPKNGHYEFDYTKNWSAIANRAAGYIVVVPEYNFSYSAALKNAIDYLYQEWAGKPMAFVGYGWGGGRNAIAHMRVVATGIKAQPLESDIPLVLSHDNLDETGQIKDPATLLASYDEQIKSMVAEFAKLLNAVEATE